ncbi:hypothetical protein CN367_11910 [Priestia megaterium]|uniref:RecB family exonuclease n=1 Tax=Priestia megaterium TaxID=1404 RepID=UPI000BF835C7|nr:PD-(D/E)XK nuclease family protein [Priestia megaterium]PEZ47064.1 hypothetical protein CN367_11910 [Priestia megaterium]
MYELQLQMELAKRYPIPYYSYSQLNTFLQCPHSYYLTYVEKKFSKAGNKYTNLGSVLHDIFEAQGKKLIYGDDKLTKGQALKQFNQNFFKIEKRLFADKEDFIKLYEKGVQAIENYYSTYEDIKPLYVEKQFKLSIAEGLPPCKAFIDRIDGDEKDVTTWILSDYKTGSEPKSKDYLRNDIQMGLYVALVYAQYKKFPQAVQFVHPVPDKTQKAIHRGEGVYEFLGQRAPVVTFSVAEIITTVRRIIAEIVTAIENKGFNKVPKPWDCKSCFHFISGDCQPFVKNSGWEAVGGGR